MTAYVLKRKRPPVLQYTNDYTKTGSFGQINKGVASGFTTGNYLKAPANFSPSSNTWEWNFKFNIVTDVSTTQYILGCTNTSGSHGAMLGIVSGKFTCWLSANGTSWNIVTDGTIKTSLVAGETYYVKFGWTGSEYYIDLSTNGIDYVREYTLASTTAVHSSAFNIGTAWQLSYPFKGSIDLSQSYININGERWWSGDSYTKVGSWIEDNVVSGFSSSNYLQLPKTFNGNVGNTWEMVWKFRLNSDFTSVKDHGILACSTTVAYASSIGVNGSTKVAYVSLATNTSGSKLVMLSATTTLEPEIDYWVKVDFTGTAYNLYLSTNGTDYNLEASKESTSKWTSYTLSKIGYRNDNTVYPLKGSIDLTESYIKVDGEYWWRGAKYVNADKCYVLKRKRPTEYRKTVIDTATAGTYTFDVAKDNTTARIKLVGGGGGAGQVVSGVAEGSGGGSGAFIFCRIKLSAGTYTITNGAGGGLRTTGGVSKLSIGDITLLTANGGTGGANAGGAVGIGGTYEISEEADIEELYYASNGNSGTRGGNMVTGYGGASLYNGYGRGGNTRSGGVAGYNWVELVTDETNYDTKFNRDVCFILKRKQYWKYGTEPNSHLITTGSISFENGIARGFSNTNYLSFNIGTTQKTDLVEIDIAFNTGTWSSVSEKACGILGGDSFPEIQLYYGRSNIGGGDYIGSYVYSTNQDVEWKIQIQNGVLTILKLNVDTNEYEFEGSVNDSTVVSGIINIGRNTSSRYLKDGFVDITKLKVYKNGTLFKRFTKDVKATKDDYDFVTD